MKKNVASQSIGSQMLTAADGTAFTGSVTVYYTLDNGTQTIGSVGSGVCTHEGNGYHSYAPTQGETNGDHIAWTFIGTGAIPVTIQVYTGFPQSVDNNVLAAGATGFAAIDAVVDGIKAVTDNLPDSGALTSVATAAALTTVDTVVDGIQTDLDNATDGLGALKAIMDTSGVVVATGGVSGTSLSSGALTDIYEAVMTTAMTEGYATDGSSMTALQALYMMWSFLAENVVTNSLITCKRLDGTTTSMTFTLSPTDGNPTSKTRAT